VAELKLILDQEEIAKACEEYAVKHYGVDNVVITKIVITRGYEDRPGMDAADSVEAIVKVIPAKKSFPKPKSGIGAVEAK